MWKAMVFETQWKSEEVFQEKEEELGNRCIVVRVKWEEFDFVFFFSLFIILLSFENVLNVAVGEFVLNPNWIHYDDWMICPN